jgi:putative ABC transport system permease protein
VGARRKDILVQFLVESSFLGVIGGVLGLLLGVGGATVVKHFSGMPIALAPEYIVVALVFSILTGMVFGVYPSWKAARLDPIEALHTKG